MGLLDILNGMQNGPRGQTTPAPAGSGGMSPIAMALLGLVAYKAIKHLSPDQQPNAVPANRGIRATRGERPFAFTGHSQAPAVGSHRVGGCDPAVANSIRSPSWNGECVALGGSTPKPRLPGRD